MSKNNDLFIKSLETLKKEILDNKYPFQTKLPSEEILSKRLNISRNTLRKVLNALKEEGLIESHKGRGSFVCNKNIIRHIPVIISGNNSNFRKTEILQGIQDSLINIGFFSLVTLVDNDSLKETETILNLIKKGYKNFIVYPSSSNNNSSFYQKMMREGVHFVFVDTQPDKIACDYVSSCNFLGGYDATRKLIELGHKKIAFCTFRKLPEVNTITERYYGYLSALEQREIKPSDDLIFVRNSMSNDEFGDYILNNLSATAIVASTDELAVMLIKKLEFSKKKPAIIGFDNSLLAENLNFASINQNFYEIGKKAAELLYKRICNPMKEFEHVYIPVSLIERPSLTKPNNI